VSLLTGLAAAAAAESAASMPRLKASALPETSSKPYGRWRSYERSYERESRLTAPELSQSERHRRASTVVDAASLAGAK
jgi:hypothetical protein